MSDGNDIILGCLKEIEKESDETDSNPKEEEDLKKWARAYKAGAQRLYRDNLAAHRKLAESKDEQ